MTDRQTDHIRSDQMTFVHRDPLQIEGVVLEKEREREMRDPIPVF